MRRVVFFAFSFSRGGAAIAAQKFARIASGFADVRCYCAEYSRASGLTIVNPSRGAWLISVAKRVVSYLLMKLMRDFNPIKHSLNLFSASNAFRAMEGASHGEAVLHVHWFNNDALSIFSLGKLPRSTIITLHDEWLYCGSEHCYSILDKSYRFVGGYLKKAPGVQGIDWNSFIWSVKLKQLTNRRDIIFTVPSRWMLERAKASKILHDKDVRLLPNPIETNHFFPLDRSVRAQCRARLHVKDYEVLVAFGAVGGELKGERLLREACRLLGELLGGAEKYNVKILLFGGKSSPVNEFEGFPAVNVGRIDSVEKMREVYGVADFVAVPSLVESFGQVAAESLACETPVVAFRTSGLVDIVIDGDSGYLADPFSASSLASCMARMIRLSTAERSVYGHKGRAHVNAFFSTTVVGATYKSIVCEAFDSKINVRL